MSLCRVAVSPASCSGAIHAGVPAQVRAVRDDDSTGLRGAEAAGLLPGARVLILERRRQAGTLVVEVDDRKDEGLEVSMEVAHRIFVVARPLQTKDGGEV